MKLSELEVLTGLKNKLDNISRLENTMGGCFCKASVGNFYVEPGGDLDDAIRALLAKRRNNILDKMRSMGVEVGS